MDDEEYWYTDLGVHVGCAVSILTVQASPHRRPGSEATQSAGMGWIVAVGCDESGRYVEIRQAICTGADEIWRHPAPQTLRLYLWLVEELTIFPDFKEHLAPIYKRREE